MNYKKLALEALKIIAFLAFVACLIALAIKYNSHFKI